jgi:hypothetical protein
MCQKKENPLKELFGASKDKKITREEFEKWRKELWGPERDFSDFKIKTKKI